MAKEKKSKQETELAKLVNLTKMMKQKKVILSKEKKTFTTYSNKWRTSNPKFSEAPKPPPPADAVEAGGMLVDPSLKDEYESWRKEKEAEQQFQREQKRKSNFLKDF